MVLLFFLGTIHLQAQERIEHFSFSAYQDLNLPKLSSANSLHKHGKIRIAIVDDGFNLDHELIKPFISIQLSDIPNNYIDDDQNGFVDDSYGWNVADDNNDVAVSEGREEEFYHGTMVASIIATVFLETYDSLASDFLEILPIKAISNSDNTTYVKYGYEGISYAIASDVDIICCAWSGGGSLTKKQKDILKEAELMGITILGAAGNHFDKTLNPAANKSVIAVTAIDSSNILIPTSNRGIEIDFAARGDQVRAGHPLDERAYFYGSGTSASVALVTGVYGILLSQFPNHSKLQIVDALKYTSKTVDSYNLSLSGKLGAGMPQVDKAIQYLHNPKYQSYQFNSSLSEGVFIFNRKDTIQSYSVKPHGPFYGFEFQVASDSKKKKYILEISTDDSTYLLKESDHSSSMNQLALGNTLTIKNLSQKYKSPIRVTYQAINIDSSNMYCEGTKYLYDTKENLNDGSGVFNYTNKCDCKWVIKAPENKRIKLEVTHIDTQANIDFLWVFQGSKALQENLIAKFSGNNKPPIIVSNTNEVLLWFMSDNNTTGEGWEINYTWVDE